MPIMEIIKSRVKMIKLERRIIMHKKRFNKIIKRIKKGSFDYYIVRRY